MHTPRDVNSTSHARHTCTPRLVYASRVTRPSGSIGRGVYASSPRAAARRGPTQLGAAHCAERGELSVASLCKLRCVRATRMTQPHSPSLCVPLLLAFSCASAPPCCRLVVVVGGRRSAWVGGTAGGAGRGGRTAARSPPHPRACWAAAAVGRVVGSRHQSVAPRILSSAFITVRRSK